RDAEQRHRLAGARRVDDRREIVGPLLDCQGTWFPFAHPAAALVEAHEAAVFREELNPVSPYRAFPFVFEMGQPVRRLDHDGAAAGFRPREPDAVGRPGVLNPLPKPGRCRHRASRDICPVTWPPILPNPGQTTHTLVARRASSFVLQKEDDRAETINVLCL